MFVALAEADANELRAVAKLFASDKSVKIGCVKSNMGHSESVSGLCALTKVNKENCVKCESLKLN